MKGYWKAILVLGLCGALLALSHIRRVRWDLTDDRHYSLSEATKTLLKQTNAPIEVTLLLDGDLNAGFTRLKKATEELMDEMSVYADLSITLPSREGTELQDSLGLRPIVIHEREQNGKTAQTTIYPYALISYKGRGAVVTLLKNTRGLSGEENLNNSIEQLEYAFAEALHRLQQTELPRIAIIEGHGEPDERYVWDLEQTLSQYFYVDRGAIIIPEQGVDVHLLDGYKAIIIANPQTAFSDIERFIIDQYIMRGGTVLWVVNGVRFSNDVLQSDGFTPIIPLDLGITDMLFRYGIRVNPALVQDLQCMTIPVNVSEDPQTPNLQPFPWTYAPLLLTSNSSPITRNTGQVMSTFVSPIDAVGGEDGIDKRVLLATSTATRVTATPGEVNLNDLQPDLEAFRYQYVPVAVSLEGTFNSAFAHRMMPDSIVSDEPIRKQSVATRQVVVGSGSIIMNEVERNQVLPMGYDRYNQIQFSNRDFIANVLLWLTDSEGLIQLREKTVALRLLNDKRAHDERARVQIISTISPIAILALLGGVIWIIRKRKYASKKVWCRAIRV